jgi:serine/threonine protein kinase
LDSAPSLGTAAEVADEFLTIPFEEIELLEPPLGTGSEKTVYAARWRGQNIAVLMLRSGTCDTEASIFIKLGKHTSLTKMIGISQSPQNKQCLITELAPLGSLDNLLNQYEEDGLVPSRKVFVMALMQICSACEQLIEHGVIHCDLATSNCLCLILIRKTSHVSK